MLQQAETMSETAGSTALSWLTAINRRISRLCLMLAVAGLTALVLVVTWQVFGRYVMNDTPIWAESLALVLVLYVTMLGAAVGVRDARHIGMESLAALIFPARFQIVFEIVIHMLVAVFGALMAWHGARLGLSVMHYAIPTLGLSEGVSHIPVVIAGGLIVLFSIEHILALLYGQEVTPSWH
ncbi:MULTISPECIES: TRAP transporter small permease [Rhodomicrobium]|uniref:TRAP transporter small permease n=1 Tax=Rhodomicrobium TaxID=1068 RepID=UPI001FD90224|nr:MULTISPECIES: TRAP transporter small permease [Rhodomicrobium]